MNQPRTGRKTLRIVGDGDDVDLPAQTVRFTDLTGQQLAGIVR
ncbi:MAG TPA: hypothetical protein VHJ82_06805 [Actinomycetota bacterium]|nr:hypothetical protein [Actinomycetota bacterium]